MKPQNSQEKILAGLQSLCAKGNLAACKKNSRDEYNQKITKIKADIENTLALKSLCNDDFTLTEDADFWRYRALDGDWSQLQSRPFVPMVVTSGPRTFFEALLYDVTDLEGLDSIEIIKTIPSDARYLLNIIFRKLASCCEIELKVFQSIYEFYCAKKQYDVNELFATNNNEGGQDGFPELQARYARYVARIERPAIWPVAQPKPASNVPAWAITFAGGVWLGGMTIAAWRLAGLTVMPALYAVGGVAALLVIVGACQLYFNKFFDIITRYFIFKRWSTMSTDRNDLLDERKSIIIALTAFVAVKAAMLLTYFQFHAIPLTTLLVVTSLMAVLSAWSVYEINLVNQKLAKCPRPLFERDSVPAQTPAPAQAQTKAAAPAPNDAPHPARPANPDKYAAVIAGAK